MSKIKNFENLNTYEKSISIINFFNQLTQKKEFKLFINNIEDIIKLEKKEILFFFNKIFINNFDYNNNNFKKKISYSNIVKYFFIFNGLLLSKFFFKKKINISKNIKIILKQVDNNEQLYSYKKIINHFGKEQIFILKDNNFKCNYISTNYNYILNSIIPFKDIFKLLKLSFLILSFSKIIKINLFYFALKLIFENYFYNYIFSNSNIKAVLSHKYYSTSNVANFYINYKNGKSFIFQKNINTANSNGFFISSDCLFSLSKNCKIENELTFSKIKNHEYIGSFFMQNLNKEKNAQDVDLKYDILYLAGNGLKPKLYYDTYKSYADDYLLQLYWLKKISNQFDNLKVGFKHHSTNNDMFEENFLKDSAVKIVDKSINSYHLVEQSRFICSWASTMILESIALKKYSYFLNPGLRNIQFLKGIKNFEEISISNYGQLLSMYEDAKKNNFIKNNLNEDYCVKKKNICDEIINTIYKYSEIK
tara:strand:- start:17 stop:1450 length:1434 start_codon:yes stop_codon:yes gene_type:complete